MRRHLYLLPLLIGLLPGCSEPPMPETEASSTAVEVQPEDAMGPMPIPWYRTDAVAWAVNIGGGEVVTGEGIRFQPDTLESELVTGTIEEISGVQDPRVFRSFREGELPLEQALPNAVYDLTLFFAEPADVGPGERLFDIVVQGETEIGSLDVRQARDGRRHAGLTRTVTGVEVTDGRLELELSAVAGEPILSALLVRERAEDKRQWRLVWSDEFDYEGAPDPARWSIETWDARRVNDENQAYTPRQENVRVTGGRLVLEAHKESYNGAEYTSGRIHSRGKGDWLYGRIDMRARLPGGQGTWPALWMLPTDAFRYATRCSDDPDEWQGDDDCDAWPNSGEIDIMEHVGYDMTRLHGTVHNKAYYHINHQQRKGSVEVSGLEKAFHVYSLEWSPELIRIYFEGVPYFAYRNEGQGWESWPFDHPYHLIMNLAVGGHWGRAGGPIDDSIFPVSLEVDYVRVFQPVDADWQDIPAD